MGIDLHIHSICSDGDTSPAGLVALAAKMRLKAIAITDHDTAEGISEAEVAARDNGVEIVPGIELSTRWKGRAVHLLGYYFDTDNKELLSGLEWIQEGREIRNLQIVERLAELGVEIDMEELKKVGGPGLIGRPHIAKILIGKGVVSSMDEAFCRFLGIGALAYIERRSMETVEAIDLLHRAAGVAVVAHPYTLGYKGEEARREFAEMADFGLDGLEIYYPKHGRQFKKELRSIATKNAMVFTGGSDYHGANRPGSGLAGGKNVYVADFILDDLKKRAVQIRADRDRVNCGS